VLVREPDEGLSARSATSSTQKWSGSVYREGLGVLSLLWYTYLKMAVLWDVVLCIW